MTEDEADELLDRIAVLRPEWSVLLGTDESGNFVVTATENPPGKPGGAGAHSPWSVTFLFEQPEDFDYYTPAEF